VCADPARLQQVFWNLIKNAIKFTPDRGRITVRTTNLAADASGRARLTVEICDDGLGIESESLSRLFNAFEQGDSAITRRFGGLGLGLTISKALIELHGGTICAHSDGRDKGSKFSVELPTTSAIDRILEQIEPPAGLEARTSVRVLLVEDHKDTQRVLKRLLEQLGYTVFTAGSVASAIEAVRANELDLLISDIGLPDGTGLDLVRDLPRPLPAIALSGFGMEEDLKSSRLAGFAVHLTKPIDMPLLDAAIRRALTAQTQVV
jgi:CheY-like chemotaxis protein